MPHRPEQDGLTIHLGVGEDSPVVKTSALQGVDSRECILRSAVYISLTLDSTQSRCGHV